MAGNLQDWKSCLAEGDSLPLQARMQDKPQSQKQLPPGIKPHRCNPHLDALLDGIFAGPNHIAKPARVFFQCIKSEPGNEPEVPSIYDK